MRFRADILGTARPPTVELGFLRDEVGRQKIVSQRIIHHEDSPERALMPNVHHRGCSRRVNN